MAVNLTEYEESMVHGVLTQVEDTSILVMYTLDLAGQSTLGGP